MRLFVTSFFGVFLLVGFTQAWADKADDDERDRIQRELNQRVFGIKGASPEAPPSPKPAPVVTAPKPAPVPVVDSGDAKSKLNVEIFTGYTLAGLHLTMAEASVLETLKASGYSCNMGAYQGMMQAAGKTICMVLSQEAPKVAMIGFTNGQLLDLETHETYRTEFPEEFFTRARKKFMDSYSESARCTTKGKGEICEVFGHGYRVTFRTEATDNGAKIVHHIGRI